MPGHFYNVSLDLKEENQVTSVQKKLKKKDERSKVGVEQVEVTFTFSQDKT